ncbi:MAG: hypothetical protein PHR87_03620 [Sulfurospirillaceae bacterium]|nr:hypothetical protein [Sulfurospirillaceae bacterium]
MKYEDWVAKNTPLKRVSSLEPYRDEVQKLVSLNYTHNQIAEYLREVRVLEISRQQVQKFLSKKTTKEKAVQAEKSETPKVSLEDKFKGYL